MAEQVSKQGSRIRELKNLISNGDVGGVRKILGNNPALANQIIAHDWLELDLTPMRWAAFKGTSEVISVLHEFGCDVNEADEDGVTPLMFACLNGHVSVVKALIGFGANISAETTDGVTPLIYACMNGQVSVVKVLIELGANIFAETPNGETACDFAVQRGHTETLSLFDEEMRRRLRTFLLGALRRHSQNKTSTPVSMLNQDVLGMIAVHVPLKHRNIQ